jgi:hypothetical protein
LQQHEDSLSLKVSVAVSPVVRLDWLALSAMVGAVVSGAAAVVKL